MLNAKDELIKEISFLSFEEQTILVNIYGLDCEAKTRMQIAKEMNLTVKEVIRYEASAIKKLRNGKNINLYKNYLKDLNIVNENIY